MSNDLPPRWQDDESAPPALRELGATLASLDQPPPPGARGRVWAKMDVRKTARSWPRLALAAPAAAAVAAALLFGPTRSAPEVARVEALLGTATLRHDRGEARVGEAVVAGARLSTGAVGRAVVRLKNNTGSAYLAASTQATITTAAEAILLDRGTVVTTVEAREKRRPFRVVAGDYEVRVTGTLFQVTRTEDDVRVRVEHGRVEVSGPHGRTRLGAGESFSSRGEHVDPVEAEAVALLRPTPLARAVEPAPEPPPPPQRRLKTRARLVHAPQPEPPPEPADGEPDSAAPERPVSAAEKYAEAMACDDEERAIGLFDEIADGNGPRAELARYQAARLTRTRDLREAVDRYERLLSQYPNGAVAQEARLDVIECAMQLEQFAKATYHIDVFLDAFPNSERTAEVHFLRAEVSRRTHDCASAIDDYDVALSSPRRVGDALFFKAWCHLRYGESDMALPLLERYLKRFPVGRHAAEARRRVAEIRALPGE